MKESETRSASKMPFMHQLSQPKLSKRQTNGCQMDYLSQLFIINDFNKTIYVHIGDLSINHVNKTCTQIYSISSSFILPVYSICLHTG